MSINIHVWFKLASRQAAGNWFGGTVYKSGSTHSTAHTSSLAMRGWSVGDTSADQRPHEGYTNWNAGYYSHIIHASGPEAAIGMSGS